MVTLYATVSGGTIDPKHQRSWLTDGRPGRPARATSGTNAWTVTGSGNVNFVAVSNCNLDNGQTIAVSGGVSANLVVNRRGDNICKNPWTSVSLAAVSSLVFSVTANSNPVTIGEVFAGQALELTRGTKPGGRRVKEYHVTSPQGWSSVPGYSPRQNRWRHSFDVTVTKAQYEAIQLWEEQTYNGVKPSVIVPDLEINDCFVVKFLGFDFVKQNPETYDITLNFLEFARIEWNNA
jgi:hypothetical protein